VVPGEAVVAPADLAAVPEALPAPPPSAANAQPDVIAMVVAKTTVDIFTTIRLQVNRGRLRGEVFCYAHDHDCRHDQE
jgi:hypothetical protein